MTARELGIAVASGLVLLGSNGGQLAFWRSSAESATASEENRLSAIMALAMELNECTVELAELRGRLAHHEDEDDGG